MQQEQILSKEQMKDALAQEVGSKFPLKITRKNGESSLCYIRGFADQQTNILLFSDTLHSVGLRIIEVKDIDAVEYVKEGFTRILRPNGFYKRLRLRFSHEFSGLTLPRLCRKYFVKKFPISV